MQLIALLFGSVIALAIWFRMIVRWQSGIYYLIAFVPYAGVLTLMLRPNPIGSLVKDILFVLPLYAIFFLLNTRELRHARIPNALTLIFIAFGTLVFLQLFNPNLRSIVIGLVGVKVWLLYIPLAYIVSAMMRTPEELVRLFRLAVVLAVFPCALGLAEFVLSASVGYQATMTAIYGKHAYDVTQGFTLFFMGADIYRIPSTFTFVAQYAGFTLTMVVVTYIHLSIEPDARWRTFAQFMIGFVFVACMLTGARANFLFTPLLFFTILFLDGKLTRLALGLVFGPLVMFMALETAGFDVLKLFGATTQLTQNYGEELVIPDLIRSLTKFPLGSGVGMNTGGVTNLMSATELAAARIIEGYYSKAVIELGYPGLMLLLLLVAGLILYGLQVRATLRDPMARSCASAIVAFLIIMAIHSLKGWQVDLDPINVWYWVLVGILFSLPGMDFTALGERRKRSIAEREAMRRQRPARRRGRPAPALPARPARRGVSVFRERS